MKRSPVEASNRKRRILSENEYALASSGRETDSTSYSSLSTTITANSSFRSVDDGPRKIRKPPKPPKPDKDSKRFTALQARESANNSDSTVRSSYKESSYTASSTYTASTSYRINSQRNMGNGSYVNVRKSYPSLSGTSSNPRVNGDLPRRLSGPSNDRNDVSNIETKRNPPARLYEPTTKAQSEKKNKFRLRCCMIVVFTSLALIIGAVLAIVLLVIPNIAQNAVDNSKFSFTSLALSDPTADPSNLKLQGNGTLEGVALDAELKASKVGGVRVFSAWMRTRIA